MRYQDQTVVVAGPPSAFRDALIAAFAAEGAQALPLDADWQDADSVNVGVQRIAERNGRIDVLVTNMLLPMPAEAFRPAVEVTPQLWDAHQRQFHSSVYYANYAVGKLMLARGQGAIVNLAPVAGLFAQKRQVSYTAAAAGVFMLTQALAVEWAAAGVRVNAVACGIAPRNDAEPIADGVLLSRIPMGRRAEYREFTDAVLFAAGDEASFVTGEIIRVDGGWTAYHLFFPFEGAF